MRPKRIRNMGVKRTTWGKRKEPHPQLAGGIRNECERTCLNVAFLHRFYPPRVETKRCKEDDAVDLTTAACMEGISVHGYMHPIFIDLLRTALHASCYTTKIFQITGRSYSGLLHFIYLAVKLRYTSIFYVLLILWA